MGTSIGSLGQAAPSWSFYFAILLYFAGSFTALDLLSRASEATGRRRLAWLVGGSIVFGWGLWATEYVMILRFGFSRPITYPLLPTMLSMAIATFGALPAFGLLIGVPSRLKRVGAGIIVGASVVSVHFLRLGSSHLPAGNVIAFQPIGLTLLATAGIVLTAIAVQYLRLASSRQRLASAALLTLALVVLRLSTRAIFEVLPGPVLPETILMFPSQSLALVIILNTLLILLVSNLCLVLDRRSAQRVISEAARLHELTDITFEGILVVDHGIVIDANPSFCRMSGRVLADLIGRALPGLVAPDSAPHVTLWLNGAGPEYPQIEVMMLRQGGPSICVDILGRAITYRERPAIVIAFRDASDRARAEAQIRHLAHHDSLTGLANRLLFNERLAAALAYGHRGDELSILCLDLDGFKIVNDQFGHATGDELLVQAAARLRATIRTRDTLARVGGDEFAIVQPLSAGIDASEILARRLIASIARPFHIDGHELKVTISVGIALFPINGTDATELLRNADMALYRAKRATRGSYCFFDPAMGVQLRNARTLTHDLRAALGTDQLSVHYQPMVDCHAGKVMGFEALMRWTHPERGPIPPGEFIPLAENSGLIAPLGLWILETACRQAMDWPRAWRIAVNISPEQLRENDFIETLTGVLRRTGLSPERLELEVTEGVLISDAERALSVMTALKAMGVRVSLDDFGTGFSSLSYLRRFRFDRIKIDQSFIRGLGEDGEAVVIVRAILALGDNLGLAVTAEGVETEAQLDLLRTFGCDEVQGYLLGRPAPSPRVEAFSRDDWSSVPRAVPEVTS